MHYMYISHLELELHVVEYHDVCGLDAAWRDYRWLKYGLLQSGALLNFTQHHPTYCATGGGRSIDPPAQQPAGKRQKYHTCDDPGEEYR